MAAALLAAGCTAGQGGEQLGPLWDHLTGPAYEGRESPPGAAGGFPNLGTIPERPTVPDIAVRDALTAALAEERQRSRNPLDAEMRPVEPRPAGTEGDRSMPMQAPRPPSMAAVPRITWDPVEPAAPAAIPVPAPPRDSAPTPRAPAAAPPQARPEPPAVAPGPPPPPPADLLAPSGPPPLPAPDLLAPRSR